MPFQKYLSKNWCIRYCQSHWRCIAIQRTIDVLKSNWKFSESTFIGSWYPWLIDLLSASDTGKNPLVRITVLKNKVFVLFLCGFLVCQFLLLGISFVLPNFVQIVLGKDAFIAGLVMMPGAAVGAILAPISGRVLDSFGAKNQSY